MKGDLVQGAFIQEYRISDIQSLRQMSLGRFRHIEDKL
jgi:hypothetical protein